jgi:hypothetical protein
MNPQQPIGFNPFPGNQITRLFDCHFACLLEQLSVHAAQWRLIGTYLGFCSGELDNIQANPQSMNSPVRCLSDMLTNWFQWAPGDSRRSTSFATLESLKHALSQARLGAAAYNLRIF